MRLIDADELLKFPIRFDKYDKKNGNEHFVFGIESVLEYAENLPTIDAVEVVRCKDCKFGVYEKGRGIYHIRCEILEFLFQDDDYCSYGERKEE